MDGSVWHVEKIPEEKYLYSVACMFGGFAIVSLTNTEFTTVYKNEEIGKKLVYGVSSEYISQDKYLLGVCTFKDQMVRTFEIDLQFNNLFFN